MSQTAQLVATLKRCLRAKGVQYRDVAATLGLSESSVKRLFSEQSLSLQRLEEICRSIDMTVYDLSRLAATDSDQPVRQLSLEQEQALAEQPLLLSYFYLLLIGWKPHRIGQRLGLDERGQVRCLTKLDRLKLIELLPRKRVRLLTDTRITWRPGGPIRSRYESTVKREFLNHDFDQTDESFWLESAELSDASIKVLTRRINRLMEEFGELAEIDRGLPKERKRGFGFVVGARPWTFWSLVEDVSK